MRAVSTAHGLLRGDIMKLLDHLLSIVRHLSAPKTHDDTLRAGKEAADHQNSSARWNSLLL
jgi:hypothetical protein